MKRILVLLLVLAMVLALTACGGPNSKVPSDTTTESGAPAVKKDTLNIAFTQDRGTLDPSYMIGYDGLNAMRMVYEGLWEWDNDGNQDWILCTGIDFVSDTCWHLHIREGVKFSNGNPLTAEDVVFSLDKANHRTGEPEYLPQLDLENTKAIDEYTVEMNFYMYDLSYIYGMTSLMIYDKESYDEASIAQNPIGTGPYKLDDYVVNSHISLSLRDDYWGEMPSIKYMNFRIYTEESQMTNAIVTGEVDICTVPLQDIDYVKESGKFNVDVIPSAQRQTRALYFNTTEYGKLAGNALGRQAIAMAIDVEAIRDIAYSGYGEVSVMPCNATCVDADESLFNYGVYGIGYDSEQASKLAEEAGIVGETFSISTNGTADAIVCAELIQSDLEAIGIHVEIKNYDTGSWLAVAFSPADAGDMLIDFTGVPSQTVAQNVSCWYLYHLGGGYTQSEFENKERMDEISVAMMAQADEDIRAEWNKEICQIQTDAMLWYSLIDRVAANGYAVGLEGYEVMLMGNVNYAQMRWAD